MFDREAAIKSYSRYPIIAELCDQIAAYYFQNKDATIAQIAEKFNVGTKTVNEAMRVYHLVTHEEYEYNKATR